MIEQPSLFAGLGHSLTHNWNQSLGYWRWDDDWGETKSKAKLSTPLMIFVLTWSYQLFQHRQFPASDFYHAYKSNVFNQLEPVAISDDTCECIARFTQWWRAMRQHRPNLSSTMHQKTWNVQINLMRNFGVHKSYDLAKDWVSCVVFNASEHIACFWGDLRSVNEHKIRSDKIDTFEQFRYEIDSHLVSLGVHQIWSVFNWNVLADVMDQNIQEMILGGTSITFFWSITRVRVVIYRIFSPPDEKASVFFHLSRPKKRRYTEKKHSTRWIFTDAFSKKGIFPVRKADFSRDENKTKCHFYVFAQVIVITFEHFGSIWRQNFNYLKWTLVLDFIKFAYFWIFAPFFWFQIDIYLNNAWSYIAAFNDSK